MPTVMFSVYKRYSESLRKRCAMNLRRMFRLTLFLCTVLLPALPIAHAQVDPALFQELQWRSIGPDRGGRVTAVAGLVHDRWTYYMGATGGGVWKTVNAGITWVPVFWRRRLEDRRGRDP